MDIPTNHTHHFLFMGAVAIAAAFGAAVAVWSFGGHEYRSSNSGYQSSATDMSSCNVLALNLHGQMVSERSDIPPSDTFALSQSDGSTILSSPNYAISGDIEEALMRAADDEGIQAVILDVDSPGGTAVAGEEVTRALRALGKPSVAVVHGMGASAAYMAAVGTDRIYALAGSDIGSIGVTSSYIDQSEKNRKDGYTYHVLSSGPYKDTFSPDKSLTAAEEALIMRDIKIARDNFVKLVADLRHQPVEKISALADGSTMMGQQALSNGLIDEIGGLAEAKDYLAQKIGEPVTLCWQ